MDSKQDPAIQQGLSLLDSFTKERIYQTYFRTIYATVMKELLSSTLRSMDIEEYREIHDPVRAGFRATRFGLIAHQDEFMYDDQFPDMDEEEVFQRGILLMM